MTLISTDVLIVGGGPAGLAAAIAARRRGLRVLVADCARPPVDKACGEGLMPGSVAALHALGIGLDGIASCAFRGIRFIGPEAAVASDFPHGLGIAVRRTVLHQRLWEAAAAAGADMAWGARVSFAADGVRVNGAAVSSRWIIGADGQKSMVRAWAGLGNGREYHRRIGLRRHFRIAPWSDYVEVYWGDDYQAYVTGVAADEVCVALLSRRPVASFASAIAGFPDLHRKLRDAPHTTPLRGAVTVSRRLNSVCHNRVALIGDASGSVDAITGEGLGLCFRQAVALADALASDDLSLYEAAHRRIMKLPLFMGRSLLRMDGSRWLRAHALRAFAETPELFARLMSVHLGDLPLARFGLSGFFQLGWELLTA